MTSAAVAPVARLRPGGMLQQMRQRRSRGVGALPHACLPVSLPCLQVQKVTEAVKLVKSKRPDVKVGGAGA